MWYIFSYFHIWPHWRKIFYIKYILAIICRLLMLQRPYILAISLLIFFVSKTIASSSYKKKKTLQQKRCWNNAYRQRAPMRLSGIFEKLLQCNCRGMRRKTYYLTHASNIGPLAFLSWIILILSRVCLFVNSTLLSLCLHDFQLRGFERSHRKIRQRSTDENV